jgi:hypothetical protein
VIEDNPVRHWISLVSRSAMPFESRWTSMALKRVAPDVHRRLTEQRALFDHALARGSAAKIGLQGAALCRGYTEAFRVLERAAEPDDAYQLGQDPRTGLRVAIGQQKSAAQRVRELHGEAVVWITPDEVAAFLGSLEAFGPTAAVKRLVPGAEIVDVRPANL